MCMLPKAICRVNEIPIKIPMMYFTKLEEIFQKFTCNHKRPCVATVILGKKNKIGVITLPSIKLCSREYISSRLEVSLRAFSSLKWIQLVFCMTVYDVNYSRKSFLNCLLHFYLYLALLSLGYNQAQSWYFLEINIRTLILGAVFSQVKNIKESHH